MGNIKEINIKDRTYYLFDDMINIRNFNGNLLKIDKKLYKNIDICYIGYITKKKDSKYVNIHSVNLLYFIVDKLDGFIEEKEGKRYLSFAFTDNNKKIIEKYAELWNELKKQIERIDNKQGGNGKVLMKTSIIHKL